METTPSLIGILVGVAEPLSPGSVEIREQKCMRGWMDRYGKEGRSVCTEAPSLPPEAVMYVKAVHDRAITLAKWTGGLPPHLFLSWRSTSTHSPSIPSPEKTQFVQLKNSSLQWSQ